MKNNRQIGLDGRIFISSCMRRGPLFAIILMLYGILAAAADILKLTGASGVIMSPFTTTLLIYDFIVSLMLVVVVFYAYFLECGADIPVLKEKPLVVFGLFRLGYYVLLAYYVCYRAFYCLVNRDSVPASLSVFYFVYLALIVLLILANCYIYNILTRNIIRRSYSKSFRRLSVCGLVFQALLPITYIFARIFMKDLGDEYFTTAVCDLIRLCICPILLTSIWFLFLYGTEQVKEIYSEVDTALLNKQYQITYSADSKNSRRKSQPIHATVLPAPTANPSLPAKPIITNKPKKETAPAQLPPVEAAANAAVIASVVSEIKETEENAQKTENTTGDAADVKADDNEPNNASAANVPADVAAAIAAIDTPEDTDDTDDETVADFAAEARKAVAKAAAKNKLQNRDAKVNSQPTANKKPVQHASVQPAQKNSSNRGNGNNQPQPTKANPPAPVQEFDPFPADSVPRKPQQKTGGSAQRSNQNRPVGSHQNNHRSNQRGNNYNNRGQSGQPHNRNNSGGNNSGKR